MGRGKAKGKGKGKRKGQIIVTNGPRGAIRKRKLEPLEPLEPFFHYPPVFEKLWEYIVKGFQGFQTTICKACKAFSLTPLF